MQVFMNKRQEMKEKNRSGWVGGGRGEKEDEEGEGEEEEEDKTFRSLTPSEKCGHLLQRGQISS